MNPIEHLYFQANFQPDHVAIQYPTSDMTWGKLLRLVRGVAYKLQQIGVRPNQVVVTCLRHRQLEWIVTLGLMHEAVATCSALGPPPLELEPDFVITAKAFPDFPNDKTIVIDNEWLKDLPQPPDDFKSQAFAGEESLFRLILTSGTTGQRKAAECSLGVFLKRCERMTAPSHAYATEVCMMGLSSVLGFTLALRNLLRGTACYFANSVKEVVHSINVHHVECLSGSPQQFAALIEEIQRTSRRLPSLKMVWYAGGEASSALISNIRRELCPTVICLYGSTEVGGVSSYLVHDPNRRPGMAGYVVPEAQVQIVNDEHRPLDPGEEGTLRVRSSSMARGYYKNPEETGRSYRDGWFYPGDRARLLQNGMLILTGREGELINRGGVKVSPVEIDNLIQGYNGILDAATFGYENNSGLEDICAAVVVAKDFNMELFRAHLAQLLTKYQNPSLIIRLKEIPRNQMGKPLRRQMCEQYGDMLRQQSTTTPRATRAARAE
jgi:acyl-CoA synthetase (AMP-forming)/AMP-acid ligase II